MTDSRPRTPVGGGHHGTCAPGPRERSTPPLNGARNSPAPVFHLNSSGAVRTVPPTPRRALQFGSEFNAYSHTAQEYPVYVVAMAEQPKAVGAAAAADADAKADVCSEKHSGDEAAGPRGVASWPSFLSTLHPSPPTHKLYTPPSLSGPWEGHDRLRAALEPELTPARFTHAAFLKRAAHSARALPLVIRATSIVLTATAIALAGSIYKIAEFTKAAKAAADGDFDAYAPPSPLMTLVVQLASLVYLLTVFYDEYAARPIGLRDPAAKFLLIMLDLLFVIFNTANLAVGFVNLTENGVIDRTRALVGVLLVLLVSWVVGFGVSILRVVDRVA